MYGYACLCILTAVTTFATVKVDGKSPNSITAFVPASFKSTQIHASTKSNLALNVQRDGNENISAVLKNAVTSFAFVLGSFPSVCSAATSEGRVETTQVIALATIVGALLTIKINGDVDIDPISGMYEKKSDQKALSKSEEPKKSVEVKAEVVEASAPEKVEPAKVEKAAEPEVEKKVEAPAPEKVEPTKVEKAVEQKVEEKVEVPAPKKAEPTKIEKAAEPKVEEKVEASAPKMPEATKINSGKKKVASISEEEKAKVQLMVDKTKDAEVAKVTVPEPTKINSAKKKVASTLEGEQAKVQLMVDKTKDEEAAKAIASKSEKIEKIDFVSPVKTTEPVAEKVGLFRRIREKVTRVIFFWR